MSAVRRIASSPELLAMTSSAIPYPLSSRGPDEGRGDLSVPVRHVRCQRQDLPACLVVGTLRQSCCPPSAGPHSAFAYPPLCSPSLPAGCVADSLCSPYGESVAKVVPIPSAGETPALPAGEKRSGRRRRVRVPHSAFRIPRWVLRGQASGAPGGRCGGQTGVMRG